MRGSASPTPHLRIGRWLENTVTCRLPQLGHMRRYPRKWKVRPAHTHERPEVKLLAINEAPH